MKPPKRVWHVAYLLVRETGDFETRQRFFDRSDYASNMVRSCEKYPRQLRLIGVHRGQCEWEAVEL